MELQQLQTLQPLNPEDLQACRHRTFIYLRDGPQERKFGFYSKTPNYQFKAFPKPGEATIRTDDHVRTLQEIIQYAGISAAKHPRLCPYCAGKGKQVVLDKWDYVFRPLPDGVAYRWPIALMHYLVNHRIDSPDWLPIMVQDFNKAKALGLWQSGRPVKAWRAPTV